MNIISVKHMCTEIKDVKEMSRLMYTLFKDIQCIFLNKNKLQIYKSNKQTRNSARLLLVSATPKIKDITLYGKNKCNFTSNVTVLFHTNWKAIKDHEICERKKMYPKKKRKDGN